MAMGTSGMVMAMTSAIANQAQNFTLSIPDIGLRMRKSRVLLFPVTTETYFRWSAGPLREPFDREV